MVMVLHATVVVVEPVVVDVVVDSAVRTERFPSQSMPLNSRRMRKRFSWRSRRKQNVSRTRFFVILVHMCSNVTIM